ncbi:MAG TPA: hypothetical protein GXZ70_04385 [Clostridiales bacterium]|nr:hypothetical protein [Clostridiales bacterium]
MNLEEIRSTEYSKCVNLLAKLIDLDDNTKEKIHKCFQSMGIKNLFINLESLDIPFEICEKLKNIKSVIEMFDE